MSANFKIIKKPIYVSIITISQLGRQECLKNLHELIKLQTYTHILEWVIVEGSKTAKDAKKNKEFIDELIKNCKIKINYLEFTGAKLSDLRNAGNRACKGEIIVVMDDDDYYPPERVSHAVETLDKSGLLLAGCSDIYMYEYFLDKLYKFKGFHGRHGTNNCMAFKRDYLKNHAHESGLEMSEERSFTNNHNEPMVQLIPEKCIIVSSHNLNTVNKRELCVGGTYGINPTVSEVIDHDISLYMPKNIFDNMKKIFYKEEPCPYDIVYYTGAFTTEWNPQDKSLGGSEQAIVKLSESWAKKKLRVAVYANIKKETIHNNVEYRKWNTLPFNYKFKTIILWRANGFFSGVPFNLKADKIYWDLHDNFIGIDKVREMYQKYSYKINKIMFKSNYHLKCFEDYFKVILKANEYVVIPNGIMIETFSNNVEGVARNPYRLCYVSYYTRGLQSIIPNLFYYLNQIEPRTELHLYYGMDMLPEDVQKQYKMLLTCPSVIDHGRQPIEIIAREKHMSNFQLYITNTIAEIDCISIRESLVAGCIPLISNFGVFDERDGIHFNYIENNVENNKQICMQILKLMREQEKLDILRETLKKSDTIVDWDTIANRILEIENLKN
jgi:glycosyltransferase involved in cell wall biosynthesis